MQRGPLQVPKVVVWLSCKTPVGVRNPHPSLEVDLIFPGNLPCELSLLLFGSAELTCPLSAPIDSLRGTPARQSKRSESVDSLGGLSPTEITAIQCKNIPDYLNDRTVLEDHFGKIAKVQRIYTRRSKKLAVVHFFDHVSSLNFPLSSHFIFVFEK